MINSRILPTYRGLHDSLVDGATIFSELQKVIYPQKMKSHITKTLDQSSILLHFFQINQKF